MMTNVLWTWGSSFKRIAEARGFRCGAQICREADVPLHLRIHALIFLLDISPIPRRAAKDRGLLGFLLLLLADADLEVQLLGFLERLVIVPRHGIVQICVHIGVLRQNRHNGEVLVAGRAERPEALHIRDCHTVSAYHVWCWLCLLVYVRMKPAHGTRPLKTLDRVLSKAGLGSRSDARKWIGAGRVKVNGKLVQTPDHWVDLQSDSVTLDDRAIRPGKKIYLVLYKPK